MTNITIIHAVTLSGKNLQAGLQVRTNVRAGVDPPTPDRWKK